MIHWMISLHPPLKASLRFLLSMKSVAHNPSQGEKPVEKVREQVCPKSWSIRRVWLEELRSGVIVAQSKVSGQAT